MTPTPFYEDDHVVIYNGDCLTMPEVWAIPGAVLVTDPPYGMALKSGMGGAFGECEVANDGTPEVRDAALDLWKAGGEGPGLVFGRWSVPRPPGTRMVLTWEKGNHVGMGDLSTPWKPNTEEVYVLGTGFVGHRGSSVLRYLAIAGTVGQAAKGTRHHPTEKPVDLMQDLLSKCPPEALVVDPFMGAGSTLRAAKNLNRRAVGIELNPDYCAAAVSRLAQEVLDFG